MKLKGFWKLAQFLTFIALLRCAFYHAQCGHKGRENPDIVNSQSLRQAMLLQKHECVQSVVGVEDSRLGMDRQNILHQTRPIV